MGKHLHLMFGYGEDQVMGKVPTDKKMLKRLLRSTIQSKDISDFRKTWKK